MELYALSSSMIWVLSNWECRYWCDVLLSRYHLQTLCNFIAQKSLLDPHLLQSLIGLCLQF